MQLALMIDVAAPEELEQIGVMMRTSGGVELLAELLDDPMTSVHQSALLVIGNLATETVDPQAEATRALLKAVGGFRRLLPHLSSSSALTVAYALGAVQNTCMDLQYVGEMQSSGAVLRLQVVCASLLAIPPSSTPSERPCTYA